MSPRTATPGYVTYLRGRWCVNFRWVDPVLGPHWVVEPTPYTRREDRRLAVQHAHLYRQEWITQREQRAGADIVTVANILDAYEHRAKDRGTRWDRDQYRVAILRQALGPDTPWDQLTVARVTATREELRRRRNPPLTQRSANAYTTLLQAAINHAVDLGMIPHNPCARLRRYQEAVGLPRALSPTQVGAILAALADWERYRDSAHHPRPECRPRVPLREYVTLAYYTAGRPEAIRKLRWEDLDAAAGLLVFPTSKGHHNVLVPLAEPLQQLLGQIRPPVAKGLILPSPDTGRPVVNLRTQWRRLLVFANRRLPPAEQIPLDTVAHQLRHSRISHLLLAGVPPQAVAQLAGTSVAMIARRYAHLLTESLRHALQPAADHPALRPVAATKTVTNTHDTTGHRMSRDVPQRPN